MLVDKNGRTLVVLRFKERNNVVTIATSMNKTDWQFIDLTSEALGNWEPTCDAQLWQRENKLHLLYQPVGLGQITSALAILEWDVQAHFLRDSSPEKR